VGGWAMSTRVQKLPLSLYPRRFFDSRHGGGGGGKGGGMVTLIISADEYEEAMKARADEVAEEARAEQAERRRQQQQLRHWKEHYDDEGQPYFYNACTGESRAERPTLQSTANGPGAYYDQHPPALAHAAHAATTTEPVCCRLGMRLEVYGHRVLVMGLVRTVSPQVRILHYCIHDIHGIHSHFNAAYTHTALLHSHTHTPHTFHTASHTMHTLPTLHTLHSPPTHTPHTMHTPRYRPP
jgi:hypothetical protein